MNGIQGNYTMVLTPPGAGAIGVVRVGGAQALAIVGRAFRSRGGLALSALVAARPDRVCYGSLLDGDETIDDVLVSRTDQFGSSVIDICAHGGTRVMERVLQTLDRLGAPLCAEDSSSVSIWPGDNRIEREAWECLGHAKTQRCADFLAQQAKLLPIRLNELADLCNSDPNEVDTALRQLMSGYTAARTLIEGATLAILGPPNSGKSTLFNRLIGRQAAIVSPQAGTTRDWVAEPVEMHGVPMTLIDTAGRHDAAVGLEDVAIQVGRAIAQQAHLCIILVDGSKPISSNANDLCSWMESLRARLWVINKVDLPAVFGAAELTRVVPPDDGPPEFVSGRFGMHLEKLVKRVIARLGLEEWSNNHTSLFTPRQMKVAIEVLSDLTSDRQHAAIAIRAGLVG